MTEYSVLCVKHIFPQHVVLQVKFNNTCLIYELLFGKYIFLSVNFVLLPTDEFQFDCNNTLNDQLLENVYVELEQAPDTEGWTILHTIPLEKLPFGVRSTTYLLLKMPSKPGVVMATFSSVLKFKVRDVDPTTGELEGDESYNDVFVVCCSVVKSCDNS